MYLDFKTFIDGIYFRKCHDRQTILKTYHQTDAKKVKEIFDWIG